MLSLRRVVAEALLRENNIIQILDGSLGNAVQVIISITHLDRICKGLIPYKNSRTRKCGWRKQLIYSFASFGKTAVDITSPLSFISIYDTLTSVQFFPSKTCILAHANVING